MRTILTCLVLVLASPVFAMSDSIVDYCLTTTTPRQCITSYLAEERAFQQDQQARQYQSQLDLMREQSRGLALFGSGLGMINGMNQGFAMMRLPVSPPMTTWPPVR